MQAVEKESLYALMSPQPNNPCPSMQQKHSTEKHSGEPECFQTDRECLMQEPFGYSPLRGKPHP